MTSIPDAWPTPPAEPPPDGNGDFDDETVTVDALSSGGFFGDRFRVERVLGAGGMGRVVEAFDFESGAQVALKVLHPERARDAESVGRFEREAQILSSLGHPGIVRIVAMGAAIDGTPWIAMELLRGETLKERLRREGPFALPLAIAIVRQVAEALAAAHACGVVHRDLKPENVLLVDGPLAPTTKVLDFGLSRFTASKTLTRQGAVIGTPRYMAPEQILSASSADLRVDVYALAVIAFEVLTGRSPYPAEDMGQLLGCVMEGRRVPFASLRPDLPASLGEALAQGMARDPGLRPATAPALVASLTAAAQGAVPVASVRPPSPTPPSLAPAGPVFAATVPPRAPSTSPAPAHEGRRALLGWAIFAVALAIVVVVAALVGVAARRALGG